MKIPVLSYLGVAFAIASQLSGAALPTNVSGWATLLEQIALTVDPALSTNSTFQMVQSSLSNVNTASAASAPGEIGQPVKFQNNGQTLYLHFVISTSAQPI